MCPPVVIAAAIVAVAAAGAGALQAVQADKAAKADYAGKVQAQEVATEQLRSDRDALQQQLYGERATAERQFSQNQMDATLQGEALRAKALTQSSIGGSVSSATFDQFERQTYLTEGEIKVSNLWNLQQNARNLKAQQDGAYRREATGIFANRAGAPPADNLAMNLAVVGIGAVAKVGSAAVMA